MDQNKPGGRRATRPVSFVFGEWLSLIEHLVRDQGGYPATLVEVL
jgi:hypothetical protein